MTRVKICGITNLDDARMAVEAGADMLGFNFYEKSPRYVTSQRARSIIEELPTEVVAVGIFVNDSVENIMKIAKAARLNAIQLHGDESTTFVESVRKSVDSDVIKAFRVNDEFEPADTLDYSVEGVLLDGFSASERGGTGEVFDWEVARAVRTLVGQLWLAGGLTPDNVGDAVRTVRPFAVDVCSAVESSKALKDESKVRAFVRNAKKAL